MATPLVSVLIPTYDRATTVERAVRSALEQDVDDLEVVVSDNASTDGTAAVLARLASDDPRVRVVTHASNLGPIPNWRAALEASAGRLVKVVWSDDWMEPGALAALLDPMQADPDCGFAVCPVDVHLPRGIEVIPATGVASIGPAEVAGTVLAGWPHLSVSPAAALLWREDVEWALAAPFTVHRLGAECSSCARSAIGPDLLMTFGALRRGRRGRVVAGARVGFGGGADSITRSTAQQRMDTCYQLALAALIDACPPDHLAAEERAAIEIITAARAVFERVAQPTAGTGLAAIRTALDRHLPGSAGARARGCLAGARLVGRGALRQAQERTRRRAAWTVQRRDDC